MIKMVVCFFVLLSLTGPGTPSGRWRRRRAPWPSPPTASRPLPLRVDHAQHPREGRRPGTGVQREERSDQHGEVFIGLTPRVHEGHHDAKGVPLTVRSQAGSKRGQRGAVSWVGR